jgi:ribosomal protein S18 acetylase RimI-like enzyme
VHERQIANEIVNDAFLSLRQVYRPIPEATMRQTQRADSDRVFLATIDELCVGTASVFHDGDHLNMYRIAVRPQFRQRGVARSLISGAESIFRDHNRQPDAYLSLQTIRETGNVTIFERLGFSVTDEQVANWCVSDIHVELHDVTMMKRIA